MESLYKLVKKLISYLYTILLNKLCATDQMLLFFFIFPQTLALSVKEKTDIRYVCACSG